VLQGLGERTPTEVPAAAAAWTGPVLALDLTGHGHSTQPAGGGYTAEMLMGDVDAALAHLGACSLLGRGLGAYVALLAAGGRPELVRGAILTDGPGLVGGGIRPASACIPLMDRTRTGPPDPLVMVEMARDVRPPDYAVEFVRLANEWSGLDHPIAVCTVVRPEWLAAVVEQPGVLDTTAPQAIPAFALCCAPGPPPRR
jgi:pimeloyl-ACP methyl ester carboxylesterase